MIPCYAVADRVKSCVEFGTKRSAHGHSTVRPVKSNSLARQSVDIRRFGIFASKTPEIIVCNVVAQNKEKVGPIPDISFRNTINIQIEYTAVVRHLIMSQCHATTKQHSD